MAVEINIDLDSEKAHGKIQALRTDLKSLGDEVDIDFDSDGNLADKIQSLTDDLGTINVDVDTTDLEKAVALKRELDGDVETRVDVNRDKDGGSGDNLDPPDGGIDHGRQARKVADRGSDDARFSEFLNRFKRFTTPRDINGNFRSPDSRRDFINRQQKELPRLKRMQEIMGRFGGSTRGPDGQFHTGGLRKDLLENVRSDLDFDMGPRDNPFDRPDSDFDGFRMRKATLATRGDYSFDKSSVIPSRNRNRGGGAGSLLSGFKNLSGDLLQLLLGGGDSDSEIGEGVDSLKDKLKSSIPSMTTFYNLFAAILPILAFAAVNLLGVAAAMGAVAVAGASMIGLGLLGHGEDMASSWANAKKQLSSLKDEMFDVFQPTMQTFAPIQAKFFDVLPQELNKVATAMEELTVFSDTLFDALSGITDWVAGGIRGMAKYEGIISQLAMRFGELIGSGIGEFFGFILKEAYKNQDVLVDLGMMVLSLGRAFYTVAKIISTVITAFKPLTDVIGWLGELLDNKLVIGFVTFVTVLLTTIYTVFGLASAISGIIALFAGPLSVGITANIVALQGWIASSLQATLAAYGLSAGLASVVSWATLGVGALLAMGAAASAMDSINAQAEQTMSMSGAGGAGGGIPSAAGGGMGAGAGGNSSQTIFNQGDTNVTVQGNPDNATEEGMKDIATDVNSSEGYVKQEREFPSGVGL